MKTRHLKYQFFITAALVAFFIDQISKFAVLNNFKLGESKIILEHFFNLKFSQNTGAAFSIFSNTDPSVRLPFLISITIVMSALIIYLFLKLQAKDKYTSVALGLILGGALGNLIDRLNHGWVVDFLDFYLGAKHFPTFNMADVTICLGVGLIFIEDLFLKKYRK